MNKKILIVIFIILLVAAGFVIKTFVLDNGLTTVQVGDDKFKVNVEDVKANKGFAASDKNGNITPLPDNDPIVSEAVDIVTKAIVATSDRDWQTIEGNEGYEFLTEGLIDNLVNDQDDINLTKNGYVVSEKATKSSNIEITNVVVYPDKRVYVQVEWDTTLTATNDPDYEKQYGFKTGKVGDTKHDIWEFELIPVNEEYKIYSFSSI